MTARESRSTGKVVQWLCIYYTLMLLSVYWLHNAWYRHQGGGVFVDALSLGIWTRLFWLDIRRWTGSRK